MQQRVQDIDIDKDKVIKTKKDVSLKSIDEKFLNDLQDKYLDVDVYLEFDKFKDFILYDFATDNHFTELKEIELMRETIMDNKI